MLAVPIAGMAVGWDRATVVHPVAAGVGHEPDFLDLVIHGILEQPVEPGAFLGDLG